MQPESPQKIAKIKLITYPVWEGNVIGVFVFQYQIVIKC